IDARLLVTMTTRRRTLALGGLHGDILEFGQTLLPENYCGSSDLGQSAVRGLYFAWDPSPQAHAQQDHRRGARKRERDRRPLMPEDFTIPGTDSQDPRNARHTRASLRLSQRHWVTFGGRTETRTTGSSFTFTVRFRYDESLTSTGVFVCHEVSATVTGGRDRADKMSDKDTEEKADNESLCDYEMMCDFQHAEYSDSYL
ncbi:hypothetical protein BaRGS_00021007, partial [Batillaria attramentaria]